MIETIRGWGWGYLNYEKSIAHVFLSLTTFGRKCLYSALLDNGSPLGEVNDEKSYAFEGANSSRNTKFMQTAADQNTSDQ